MTSHLRLCSPALLAALLLVACPGDPDDSAPVMQDGPPLPVDLCASSGYTLLPAAELGRPVDWDENDSFDLSGAALDGLLSMAGYDSLTPVANGLRLYRFRYTTQDRGVPIEATGMIAFPDKLEAAPAEPWPVALLLHGFAGANDACAPSADAFIGPAVPALLAANGFVVVAPDYIGMNGMGEGSTASHAPLVGEQVAIGSWDALRAGLTLLHGDLADEIEGELRDDVVIWGASQGGHAAFFTELVGPYYAPEIEVAGVAASAPAHSLVAVISQAMAEFSDPTALAALTLVGMRRWYEEPADLRGLLTNEEPWYFADSVEEALMGEMDECEPEVDFDADSIDEVGDIYTQAFMDAVLAGDWDQAEPWGCYVHESSVSSSSIPRLRATPVLAVYGSEDTLVVPEVQRADYELLCEQGWKLEQLECAMAGHAEGTLWSLPLQLDWLRARLAGEAQDPARACTWNPPECCPATPEDLGCGD
jgi:dienelactone hydrolase